jgi:hypothetical protein
MKINKTLTGITAVVIAGISMALVGLYPGWLSAQAPGTPYYIGPAIAVAPSIAGTNVISGTTTSTPNIYLGTSWTIQGASNQGFVTTSKVDLARSQTFGFGAVCSGTNAAASSNTEWTVATSFDGNTWSNRYKLTFTGPGAGTNVNFTNVTVTTVDQYAMIVNLTNDAISALGAITIQSASFCTKPGF